MSEGVTTYLDHGATTPLRPEVADAMAEARSVPLGNPTGSHRPAQRARRLLEESRDEVAAALGRDPGDIVFTSGGTESANLAVSGTLRPPAGDGRRRQPLGVSSAVEHPAVRSRAGPRRTRPRVRWRELPVDHDGVVDVERWPRSSTNHRAGRRHAGQQRDRRGAASGGGRRRGARPTVPRRRVFTDAVQAAAFMDLAASHRGADLVALSAHKVGGPVGVGVLAVGALHRHRRAQHVGGGQERERRSGTQDVVGAVGWPRPCGSPRPNDDAASCGSAHCATGWPRASCASVPGTARTVAGEVATLPGPPPSVLRRHRARGAPAGPE